MVAVEKQVREEISLESIMQPAVVAMSNKLTKQARKLQQLEHQLQVERQERLR